VIIESVPNFSEGRNPDVCNAFAEAARRAGASVLDLTWDPDHNRSVLTFAGAPAAVEKAAFAVAMAALERIDMTKHQG
jgi:glutamate formiminotransferase